MIHPMKQTHTRSIWLVAAGLCVGGSSWAATDLTGAEGESSYLIGASMATSSSHIGNDKARFTLKPTFSFKLGSLRVSRSRGSSLMSAGRERLETGVSANFDLLSDWKLGASLRIDNGRSFDETSDFAGLPDVRTTLRTRLSMRRSFGPAWSWSASVDQDVLGRQGGMHLSQGVGYRWKVSEKTHWDLSLSTTWGNSRYLQTQYGIGQAAAANTGRSAYLIGSGWESLRSNVQFTHAISENWVAFGGFDLSRLLGDTARSPLVGRVTKHGLSVGFAYRSK